MHSNDNLLHVSVIMDEFTKKNLTPLRIKQIAFVTLHLKRRENY